MEELSLPLNINLKKYKFKYLALYHSFKEMITSGKLEYGYKLPASRELAKQYSLSRGIVNQVYEMLVADGYIETIVGSGSYVSFYLSEKDDTEEKQANKFQLSSWGERLLSPLEHGRKINFNQSDVVKVDFSLQNISTTHFPVAAWKKAIKQGLHSLEYLLSDLSPDISGILELREAIASHLNVSRGMNVGPDDILITNGSVNAMAILAHLLVNQGDSVLVEDPCYMRIRKIIQTTGGIPTIIPTNERNEIVLDNLKSKLVFVTPTHKYPTGRVMTLEERLNLLDWAKKNNALIVEDDIDSIYKRTGRPIEPLKSIDKEGRVIYLGTFAYTILAPLRIGYVVIPHYLKQNFLQAKYLFEPFTTSVMEQAAIASFIKSGDYAKHIRKMRRIYHQNYKILMDLFETFLPDCFSWTPSDTGMYVFGYWNHSPEKYTLFKDQCLKKRVKWDDPSGYFYKEQKPCGMFYFSNLSKEEMEFALRTMSEVYQSL